MPGATTVDVVIQRAPKTAPDKQLLKLAKFFLKGEVLPEVLNQDGMREGLMAILEKDEDEARQIHTEMRNKSVEDQAATILQRLNAIRFPAPKPQPKLVPPTPLFNANKIMEELGIPPYFTTQIVTAEKFAQAVRQILEDSSKAIVAELQSATVNEYRSKLIARKEDVTRNLKLVQSVIERQGWKNDKAFNLSKPAVRGWMLKNAELTELITLPKKPKPPSAEELSKQLAEQEKAEQLATERTKKTERLIEALKAEGFESEHAKRIAATCKKKHDNNLTEMALCKRDNAHTTASDEELKLSYRLAKAANLKPHQFDLNYATRQQVRQIAHLNANKLPPTTDSQAKPQLSRRERRQLMFNNKKK